jgi:hypothetical protein
MPPATRSPRLILMGGLLLACVGVIAWMGARLLADPSIFPPDDFVEYWAAGSLNAGGENPFDPARLIELERRAGRDTDEAVYMWNPPWTFALAMPIGVLKPRVAQLLWLAASLVLILASADRLWALYGGPAARRWVAWLLALTFLPTLFVLHAGQISAFVLAGVAGFLLAERAGRPWLAGACGVLIAIKPHLVYLFWIALAGWAVRRPVPTRWKVIAGGLLAGLAATAVPLASNPAVLDQYRDAMTHRPPDQWKSPTIGSLLREVFGEKRFDLQFVPTLIGVAWLAASAWQSRRREWDWPDRMPMVLSVSFVTASYGAWPFDLVILLPAVIQVAADLATTGDRRRIAAAAAVWVAINGAALAMNMLHYTSDMFVWMAPSLLAAYAVLRPGRPTA